jgi:pimeloyl-ACP methyl ester carboxylesterase
MRRLRLSSGDGLELEALESQGRPGMPGVAFAHGMSVDMDGEGIFVKAHRLLEPLGWHLIRFDFRAHGKSQGQGRTHFNLSGELLDLDAAVARLRELGAGKIGVAGASFGGGVAALYAGAHPQGLQALLLANPLLDYSGILRPETPWAKSVFSNWKSELASQGFVGMKADWSTLEMGPSFFSELASHQPSVALRAYRGAALALHGDLDEMVALEPTRRAFGAAGNFEVLSGVGHGFHGPEEDAVAGRVADFFKETLS